MIKLIELLNLNKMVYSDKIKSEHQKKMDGKTDIISETIIPSEPFPENSSRETRNELQEICNMGCEKK